MAENRNISFKMACGHDERNSVTYKGMRQLASDRRDMAKSLCGDCRDQLKAWLDGDFGATAYPMDLPQIRGSSDAQARFAFNVRKQEFAKFGPLMLELSQSDEPLAIHAWRSLYMRFMVTSARYWIDGRGLFNVWVWENEVRYQMKAPDYTEKPRMNSPYGWFTSVDSTAIGFIKAFDPKRDLEGKNLPILRDWMTLFRPVHAETQVAASA